MRTSISSVLTANLQLVTGGDIEELDHEVYASRR